MRRSIAAVCLVAATLAGCTGTDEDIPDDAPAPTAVDEEDEPAIDALDAIADLPAVSLRSLELPDVPEELDPVDVRTAADTVRAMAVDAFINRTRWDAGPTTAVQRSHLDIAGPGLSEQVETSEALSDGPPTAQLFVSVFDPEAQPIAQPRIVGARWNIETVEREDGPAPLVTLQVHAYYLVGDEETPQAVLVRRTIGIGGNDISRLGNEKEWLVETRLVGADECTFYSEGLITPSEEVPDASAYEQFLAEAESEEQDTPLEQMPPLADLRDGACE